MNDLYEVIYVDPNNDRAIPIIIYSGENQAWSKILFEKAVRASSHGVAEHKGTKVKLLLNGKEVEVYDPIKRN